MSVHVKYFASLRDKIGRSNDLVSIKETTTVENIWQAATQHMERPPQLMVAINHEYATFKDVVQDGDEVAFFPPVTGG